MFRERRIATRCKVAFERNGIMIDGESEDLSMRGAFVIGVDALPVGAVCRLTIDFPGAGTLSVVARVAHNLTESAARAIGRRAGVGFQFLEHSPEGRLSLSTFLDQLAVEVGTNDVPAGGDELIVIADANKAMRDRLCNTVDLAGYRHVDVADGLAAFNACENHQPAAVVAALDLPKLAGLDLAERMAESFDMVDIPLILISERSDAMTRLSAYRRGAFDFLPEPFTDEELTIRLGHAVSTAMLRARSAVLRGSLSEIPLPTLLTLFEYERKSGAVELRSGIGDARIYLRNGMVVRVDGCETQDQARTLLAGLLSWRTGEFEFRACEVLGPDLVGMRAQALILEHARAIDEADAAAAADL